MTAVDTTSAAVEFIRRWRHQATWSHARAAYLNREGDIFGAALAVARGEIRAAAADLLAEDGGAEMMLDRAARLRQSDISFARPDASCLRYVTARTWQDCAHQLDPSLPTVQPEW